MSAKGTEKEFLADLINQAARAKENLGKLKTKWEGDINDLQNNLSAVINQSFLIIMTDENDNCKLKEEELNQLAEDIEKLES